MTRWHRQAGPIAAHRDNRECKVIWVGPPWFVIPRLCETPRDLQTARTCGTRHALGRTPRPTFQLDIGLAQLSRSIRNRVKYFDALCTVDFRATPTRAAS